MKYTNGGMPGGMRRSCASERGRLDVFFKMTERDTDIWCEFRSGTSTFLTMAYILFLNPHILGEPNTSIARTDVVLGTAIASAFGSFFVGYFANLPFGLAPGLGLSAYMSYGLIKGRGLSWELSMSSAFVAGLMIFLLGLTNMADLAMHWIPTTIKIATVIGMGLLLTFIGMQSINLVVAADDDSLVKLGPLDHVQMWISLGGLMILATLSHHQVKGGVVIGIIIVTIFVWFLEGSFPSQIASLPYLQDHQLIAKGSQIRKVFENPEDCLSGILAFLLVGIFDVSGVMFGLSVLAGLDKDHKDGYVYVPNSKWVFIASGLATMVAACLGCSPIIVHIESAAGIREGGRTGFTSIVVGFWFLLSLFFAPLFGSIPQEATAPVVILIGASMMGQACEIDWKQMRIAVPAFLTLAIMPFTFSIPNGIFFGLLSNFVLSISCRSSNNSDYHDDDPEHSNVSRHITEMGKTMSYGTAGNSNHSVSNFPRNYSTDSFIRSPTLILKAEEYSSTASFSQYGGGAYSQYGSTNSLKY